MIYTNSIYPTQQSHNNLYFAASKKPLAIVDHYLAGINRVDGNLLVHSSHAGLVKAHARHVYPEISILDYESTILSENYCTPVNALANLLNDINHGVEVGAVNMSLGVEVHIDKIALELGLLKLKPKNVHEYRKTIKDSINQIDFSKSKYSGTREMDSLLNGELAKEVIDTIRLIEEITKKGIPVFIAAGNEGPNSLNLLTLADGVTSVGALNKDGSKVRVNDTYSWGSADNSIVSQWETVFYKPRPIYKENGDFNGFSLSLEDTLSSNQNEAPDLPLGDIDIHAKGLLKELFPLIEKMVENIKNPFKKALDHIFTPYKIPGTSVASPQAAARHLKKLNN